MHFEQVLKREKDTGTSLSHCCLIITKWHTGHGLAPQCRREYSHIDATPSHHGINTIMNCHEHESHIGVESDSQTEEGDYLASKTFTWEISHTESSWTDSLPEEIYIVLICFM